MERETKESNPDVNTEANTEALEDPGGVVSCSLCSFEEQYHYKGCKPPFAKSFVFSEEGYIMKDPFSPPNKGQCLLLAGDCSMCGKTVCCSTDCSIFYVKRFCVQCIQKNSAYFPSQVINKMKKS